MIIINYLFLNNKHNWQNLSSEKRKWHSSMRMTEEETSKRVEVKDSTKTLVTGLIETHRSIKHRL